MKQWASIRPAMGLLLFLEFLTWAATISGWYVAKSLVPSLTLHRMEFVPLLLVPALMTLVMIGHLRWRQKAVQSLSDAGRIDGVLPGYRIFLPTWKYLLLRLAMGALLVAWLDPKMGSRLQEVESEGIDMMVALDVSNSMMSECLDWTSQKEPSSGWPPTPQETVWVWSSLQANPMSNAP